MYHLHVSLIMLKVSQDTELLELISKASFNSFFVIQCICDVLVTIAILHSGVTEY